MERQPNRIPPVSFEFFPPKTPEGVKKLRATWTALACLGPRFFSVTYGAGGSTRDRTLGTVLEIREAGHEAAPHVSCIGLTRAEIADTLELYRLKNIRHIVALRGDLPSGTAALGELRYAAELVAFIRERTGPQFRIEVACYPEFHPQAESPRADLLHFLDKVRAGADGAITQYFYNPDSYFRFVEDCQAEGVAIPIVPGIMPIGNFTQLVRFSDACGAEIPRWLRLKMDNFSGDLNAVKAYGLDVVTAMCDRLITQGAPGLHFYTMNRADLVGEILRRLGA
ncbi:MAG: methylenetetrahydrofolate reductase [NAD(P)H] [Betaproteobacteria bacterium RIFCSPLOWO2_12_FULL_66_14]|nr:MAG: methylenetetrahydrofolate reductase [NAD(P)H] [Betaproteobacteria bacterium RIFCSPLOWO2_12_FULL_66_14]